MHSLDLTDFILGIGKFFACKLYHKELIFEKGNFLSLLSILQFHQLLKLTSKVFIVLITRFLLSSFQPSHRPPHGETFCLLGNEKGKKTAFICYLFCCTKLTASTGCTFQKCYNVIKNLFIYCLIISYEI